MHKPGEMRRFATNENNPILRTPPIVRSRPIVVEPGLAGIPIHVPNVRIAVRNLYRYHPYHRPSNTLGVVRVCSLFSVSQTFLFSDRNLKKVLIP